MLIMQDLLSSYNKSTKEMLNRSQRADTDNTACGQSGEMAN